MAPKLVDSIHNEKEKGHVSEDNKTSKATLNPVWVNLVRGIFYASKRTTHSPTMKTINLIHKQYKMSMSLSSIPSSKALTTTRVQL